MMSKLPDKPVPAAQLETAKKLWVVTVLAFWVSALVLAAVYLMKDKIDLILVSITLGLMVLGVWLKARYQLLLRKQPGAGHGEDHQPGL